MVLLCSQLAVKFTFGTITAPEREVELCVCVLSHVIQMFWIELLRSLQWDFILILTGVEADGAPSGKMWLLWLFANGIASCSTRLISVRLQTVCMPRMLPAPV